VSQTLIPKAQEKGRVAAFEIMTGTDAVLNLIRENKAHQLNSTIQTGQRQGMILLDDYLADLVRRGIITRDAALEKANNKKELLTAVQRV
jgi:twitching motility protein PilT